MISRDHSAPVLEPDAARPFPVVSLVGGKWTTFRGFAEEVTDDALGRLGRERRVDTRDMPIGGGRDFPADATARDAWLTSLEGDTGLPRARLEALLERYGTTAARVATHGAAHRGRWTDAERLPDSSAWSLGEIELTERYAMRLAG